MLATGVADVILEERPKLALFGRTACRDELPLFVNSMIGA